MMAIFSIIFIVLAETREFPAPPYLFSKFDAWSYSIGDCFLFTKSVASMYNNPGRMSPRKDFLIETGCAERSPSEYGIPWRSDILNPLQFIGAIYPYKNLSFGIAYFTLCKLREPVVCYRDPNFIELFNQLTLRSVLIGSKYSFRIPFSIGFSIGINYGDAEFPYEWKEEYKEVEVLEKYDVKGLYGILGSTILLNTKIDLACRIQSPIFIGGKYEYSYKEDYPSTPGIDNSYYQANPVETYFFYPCYTSLGLSFKASEITKYAFQLSYRGCNPYSNGKDEWSINLGVERKLYKFLWLRGGGFSLFFPGTEPAEINYIQPFALTGGIGFNLNKIEINVAAGLEGDLPVMGLEGDTSSEKVIIIDANFNF